MAAGGRRRRSIYGTRNRSQEGGERTPPARGLLQLSFLLVLLLPGAPFASFLSSASPAAEEGKGERERWRNARLPNGRTNKKTNNEGGRGRAGCSEGGGPGERMDALPPRWKKSDLVSFISIWSQGSKWPFQIWDSLVPPFLPPSGSLPSRFSSASDS